MNLFIALLEWGTEKPETKVITGPSFRSVQDLAAAEIYASDRPELAEFISRHPLSRATTTETADWLTDLRLSQTFPRVTFREVHPDGQYIAQETTELDSDGMPVYGIAPARTAPPVIARYSIGRISDGVTAGGTFTARSVEDAAAGIIEQLAKRRAAGTGYVEIKDAYTGRVCARHSGTGNEIRAYVRGITNPR